MSLRQTGRVKAETQVTQGKKAMIIDTDRMLPSIYDETKPQKKYVLSLALDGTKTRISRDIICPSNMRLSFLSEFLVRAMGWLGYHQHMFTDKDGIEYIGSSLKETYDQDLHPGELEYRDFNEWTLGDILIKKGDSMKWTYDLGDHFSHTLTLLEVHRYMGRRGMPADPAFCITGGKNSCPPDDVGGPDGYEHMLEVLKNPEDEEYQEYQDWLCEGFNPARFNIHDARLRCWDFERTVETIRMRMNDCIPPEMRPAPRMRRQKSWPKAYRAERAQGTAE